LSGEGDGCAIVVIGGDAEGAGMRKVAMGCHGVSDDMVTYRSWWCTNICASTVGVIALPVL
jgi:hypothetical protein